MDSTNIAHQVQAARINQDDYAAEILQKIIQAALDEKFRAYIQADEYERSQQRTSYRNGYYERDLILRVGTITVRVCRDRDGGFSHTIFDKYQRSEQAFVGVLIEMYVTGISTRKITHVVEELCGTTVSKSLVGKLVASIEPTLKLWRERILKGLYPYLILDARYEKVREHGHVVSKAFVTVVGVTSEGIREIIGTWVIDSESYDAWEGCFKELKERGLCGVDYVVSDENAGLRKALMKHFQGVKLQRCQVHFMRNFMSKLAKSERSEGMKLLQDVFAARTHEDAKKRLDKATEFLHRKKKENVAHWLEENIDDALVVLALPEAHRKKMKSTNMVERLNQELKRRSRVVRIFPNNQSCLRLLSALCQEVSESWSHRIYLAMQV